MFAVALVIFCVQSFFHQIFTQIRPIRGQSLDRLISRYLIIEEDSIQIQWLIPPIARAGSSCWIPLACGDFQLPERQVYKSRAAVYQMQVQIHHTWAPMKDIHTNPYGTFMSARIAGGATWSEGCH